MKKFNEEELRNKLIGLGSTSIRKNYYSELMKKQEKLEHQNKLLIEEINNRIRAEEELKKLNNELESRIQERTRELENSILELKQTQEYLIQKEKIAGLSHLVYGISHEIGTPLGTCVTMASYSFMRLQRLTKIVDEGKTPANLSDSFSELVDAGNIMNVNLARCAELLSNFRQIVQDATVYENRVFNLYEYTRIIIQSYRSELEALSVTTDIDCNEDLVIHGYPGALNQIVSNFISNSLRHGFQGKNDNKIHIKYKLDEKFIYMDYRDNGRGISETDQAKIFNPFFTTDFGKSSGLGMYIVYNLVTSQLKGKIAVSSKIGEGTDFKIIIPIEHRLSIDGY